MSHKLFSKSFSYIFVAVSSVSFIFGYALGEVYRKGVMEMYVFDLNGNQAAFIRTPNDTRILINGGANSEIIRELTKILPFYSRKIDTVITTDTDGKNVSGLIDILKRYSVEKVILPAITFESLGISTSTDQIYSVFLDTIKEKGIAVERVKGGDRIVFDSSDTDHVIDDVNISSGVYADILFPTDSESFKYSKASVPQIVMKISYGNNSVLLLNDATTKIQKFIASSDITTASIADTVPSASPNRSAPLRLAPGSVGSESADALIVSTNASPDNLAMEFIEKIKPKYLIYSKSLNSASPKSPSSNSKKEKIDPLFYLMDEYRFNVREKGVIRIISDGSEVTIED